MSYDWLNDLPLQVPIIPFERPPSPSLKKDKVLTFKLRTDPDNNSSTTYELIIPFFKTGTAEELFTFLRNVEKAIAGQNANDAASKYA